jgi:hypothetical protein
MRSGKCPKCSSNAIYHAKKDGFYPASNHSYGMRIVEEAGGKIHVANLEHYFCRACGFFETYVSTDDPKLSRIDQSGNWRKLPEEQE